MRPPFQTIKTILINILFVFATIGFISIGPSVVNSIYHLFKNPILKKQCPFSMQIYKEYPWSEQLIEELFKIKSEYKDFICWKNKPFSGKTIKINGDGIRQTILPKNFNQNTHRYLFFGASVVWGYGVPDVYTIPSIFGETNQVETVNYAVNAHEVRQSFARLANLYIENKICDKKNIVMFISGPIEAYVHFNDKNIELATSKQRSIQDALNSMKRPLYPMFILEPARCLIQKIHYKLSTSIDPMEVAVNTHEATEFIAKTTVRSWLAGQRLAASFNDDFIAIFPPTIALGRPDIDHLQQVLASPRLEFIRSTYGHIIKKIKNYPEIKFIDLTDIFDGVGPIYIDAIGHYSPKGNRIFAEQLSERLKILISQK